MNEEQIEAYLSQLKAMGYTDDMIEACRQQLEQSLAITDTVLESYSEDYSEVYSEADFNALLDGMFDDELNLVENTDLNQAQQWAVACGANLAFHNDQPLNILSSGIDKEQTHLMLSNWWSVESKAELLNTFRWLEEEGHRGAFQFVMQINADLNDEDVKNYLSELLGDEEEENIAFERWQNRCEATRQFIEDGLFADETAVPNMIIWDFGRIINLCRYGIDAEYITPEESLPIIMKAAKTIQASYHSWRELSTAYLFGRYIWNGGESYDEWKDEMDVLLENPDSPWLQLSWDTVL